MPDKDIRWIQRFSNYKKALKRLNDAIELSQQRTLSDLEEQGLIQAFEFTFDLAVKVMYDFMNELGFEGTIDKPIPIIVFAAGKGLIDEQIWRNIYRSRNKTSHTYDEEIADEVAENIAEEYQAIFIQFDTRMQLEKIQREKE